MVVRVQQGRVSGGVLAFGAGEAGRGRGVGEVVEGVGVDFGQAGAEEGADEELEALEFGLEDDEAEVGFGVRVARLLFHELDLGKDGISPPLLVRLGRAQKVGWTGGEREREGNQYTCLRILSKIRSINASGHGSNSGALRSVTHARVSSCRSRVSRGIASLSTSAKMSSMSIECAVFPSSIELLNQELHKRTVLNVTSGRNMDEKNCATFSSHALAQLIILRIEVSFCSLTQRWCIRLQL